MSPVAQGESAAKQIGAIVSIEQLALNHTHGLAAIAFETQDRPVFGVSIFDTKKRRWQKTFRTQRGSIKRLAFSADGRNLFALNADSSISILPINIDAPLQ